MSPSLLLLVFPTVHTIVAIEDKTELEHSALQEGIELPIIITLTSSPPLTVALY